MPPFRQPSQPGASAATKKPFKLPAKAGASSAQVVSSEDDDDDDDLSAALNAATSKRAMEAPPNRQKQQTAPRLPSLSPMSDDNGLILHAVSPVRDKNNDTTPVIGGATDEIPLIPTNLITRLLHESYNDKSIKTGKDASALMARYLDVFVREAVARATEVVKERQMVKDATGEGDDDDSVWLDVKDLEEVAPGMVLDF